MREVGPGTGCEKNANFRHFLNERFTDGKYSSAEEDTERGDKMSRKMFMLAKSILFINKFVSVKVLKYYMVFSYSCHTNFSRFFYFFKNQKFHLMFV